MADSFWGMDPDSVLKFGTEVSAEADKITAIAKLLGGKVNSLPWKGADATYFKNNWDSTYEKNLNAVSKALDGLAAEAKSEATAQKQASA